VLAVVDDEQDVAVGQPASECILVRLIEALAVGDIVLTYSHASGAILGREGSDRGPVNRRSRRAPPRSGEELRRAVVRSITSEERPSPSIEVFSISVETPESNYFAEGVLVHNKELLVATCDSAEIVFRTATKIRDEGATVSRYRVEVTLPRSATLDANAFTRPAGAVDAEDPLSDVTIHSTTHHARQRSSITGSCRGTCTSCRYRAPSSSND
jgi:hypothetical protein